MGILSNRVEKSELKAGDHIYTWRRAFIYAHHGIYMGENKVIHFTLLTRSRGGCEEGVIISCLDCFIGLGSLYRFEYGVGKLASAFKLRGGTCVTRESGPVEVVMARALHLLDSGFGKYDLFKNNCEDFARFCKTGQDCSRNGMAGRGSSQASSLMGQIAATLPVPIVELLARAAAAAVHVGACHHV